MRLTSARPLNQRWFRQLSRNLPLKPSAKAFWAGLPGWMKSGAAPDRPLQKRIALLADSGPLSQTTALGGLPGSSRKSASRAPVTGVATSWPTHSLEKPPATAGMRKRRPLASWPNQEAGRPAPVRPGRRGHPDLGPPQPPAPLGPDLQAKPRTGAALALAGRHQALALQHAGRRQAVVAGMPPGQPAQAVRQRPVAAPRLRAVERCIPSRRQVRRSLAGRAFRSPPAAFLLAAGVSAFLTFR